MSLPHHNLVAWQRADDLFISLHRLSLSAFPALERYELGSQLRRAAYSVVASIVEGFARRQARERVHFLNMAQSSLAEVSYCVHAAFQLGYISAETTEDLERTIRQVGVPLAGLVGSLRGPEWS